MNFYGLQKVTLLDYPDKVACTVFTGGCNLRCPFCHNATLVEHPANYQPIPEQEIIEYLQSKRNILDGVCVTGGEPLLHNIEPLLREIKRLGLLVKLDHNGTLPQRLKRLLEQRLVDYVAVDIKNSPERYGETVGIADFDMTPIYETIEMLANGSVRHEFRTTVVNGLHNADDLHEIAKIIPRTSQYFLQQYVDSGDILHNNGFRSYTPDEMRTFADAIKPYIPNVQVRGV